MKRVSAVLAEHSGFLGAVWRAETVKAYTRAYERLRVIVPNAPAPSALWDADGEMLLDLWQAALLLNDFTLAAFLMPEGDES